jgi:hypothetical protein
MSKSTRDQIDLARISACPTAISDDFHRTSNHITRYHTSFTWADMFRRLFRSYLNRDPYNISQTTRGHWHIYLRSSTFLSPYWMTFVGHRTISPDIPQVFPGHIWFGVFFGHIWIGTPIIFPRLPAVTGTYICVPQPFPATAPPYWMTFIGHRTISPDIPQVFPKH